MVNDWNPCLAATAVVVDSACVSLLGKQGQGDSDTENFIVDDKALNAPADSSASTTVRAAITPFGASLKDAAIPNGSPAKHGALTRILKEGAFFRVTFRAFTKEGLVIRRGNYCCQGYRQSAYI